MPLFRLSKNVLLLGDQFTTHPRDCAYYLVRGEKLVLIDCGCGEGHAALMRNLAKLGYDAADIDCVLATHGHYDHYAGLSRLREENPDIRLAVHENDAEQIETGDPERTCAGWMYGTEIAPQRVDTRFRGDGTFTAGGLDFEIFHTPGHTPGSICVRIHIDGKTILFIGDSSAPGNDKVGSDFDAWKDTLDRIATLDFDLLLPGHSMHWVFNPFCAALAHPLLKNVRRKALGVLKSHGLKFFWDVNVFQYSYVTPLAAQGAGKLFRRK